MFLDLCYFKQKKKFFFLPQGTVAWKTIGKAGGVDIRLAPQERLFGQSNTGRQEGGHKPQAVRWVSGVGQWNE